MRNAFYPVWIILLLNAAVLAQSPYFKILEKTKHRAVVEWTGPNVEWRHVQVHAKAYVVPHLGALPLSQNPGSPQLPIDALVFENLGEKAAISVLDSVYESASVARICPAPTIEIGEERAEKHYTEAERIYDQTRFFPGGFTQVDETSMRQRRFARVQINPVKYKPQTGEVRLLRYLRFEVTSQGSGAPRSRHKSQLDKKLNDYLAGQLGEINSSADLRKSMRSFDAVERVKIYIVDAGVYKVSGNDLTSVGVNIAQIDPQHIKIRGRGEEIACQVTGADDGILHANDEIRFYAERLTGDNEFYHAFTDSNIYWLQWDPGHGRRFQEYESSAPTEFVYSVLHTIHFEEDRDYYQGDSNADIQNSRTVPGEGWVWDKTIDPGEVFRTSFDLPGYVISQPNASLKFRVRGETLDSQPDAHHLRVAMNGTQILDTFFDDRQELIPLVDIPGEVLRAQGNTLEIESVRQGNRTSRFYFDWFEVSYKRSLTAKSNWLVIDSLETTNSGLWVDGFSTTDVSIWDVENALSITPHASGGGWTAEFLVESAAILDGNFSRFFLNNEQIYTGTRGIAVVLFDAADGKVLISKSFDTYGSKVLSDSLALLLNNQPAGTIVLAAVRDDGANNLTPAAIEALQKFGSQEIANLNYRDSWAFIGRKGDASPIAEARKASTQGRVKASGQVTFESGDSSFNVQFLPEENNGKYVLFSALALQSPLKLRWKPENPLTTVTGADYLVITHGKFLDQAQRLADYRQSANNFDATVVIIEDIYDAFNHGIVHPAAIRRFLKQASQSFSPAPSYVLLFGDASWDPKGKLSPLFSNYISSLGNPVSDALLVCFDGESDFLPDLNIGRLPVKTVADARAAVDKIIEYENTPSARWKKQFLFISGGLDESEQQMFLKQSTALADDFVRLEPTVGQPIFINKDDEEAQADARSLILDAINAGTLWTNFIGHAASRTWELMFNNPDIDDLSNKGRYPFISSMTCHTGRFAEPNQDSFGEKFLLVPDKGAIGFWGTSGWGYSYEDYLYLRQLYPTVLSDSVRTLGDIITLTKFALWQQYGNGAHVRNLILQYNLMGDPAVTLSLPTQPDLAIESQDIVVTPAVPSEADSSANIKLRVQNWGLATPDSVAVLLDIEQSVTKNQLSQQFFVPPVGFADSISYNWPLRNMAGPVEIRATIDPENKIPEHDETNNIQSSQVTVLTSTFAQVAPPNNSLIPSDNVVLKIQTPQQYFDENARYIFEIDTSSTFSSPALQTSQPILAHPLLIKWRPPQLLQDVKYFWRVHLAENDPNDSFVGVFYTSSGSEFGWRQSDALAATNNVRENISWTTNGARLSEKPLDILIQSAWTNSVGYAIIDINQQSAMQTGRGFNLVVLDQNSGEILQTGHFDTYVSADNTADMVEFINNISSGRIVLAAVSDEGRSQLDEAAFQALESLGSAKIRSLGFRDMWAIIGKKGAAPGSVPEGWEPAKANGAVVLKDTLSVVHTSGRMLSERIGPVTEWSRLEWDIEIPESADFYMHVLGYQKSTGDTVRLISSHRNSSADLSSINAKEFPFLYVDARFSTAGISRSPVLKNWHVLFTPSPDLTIGRQLVAQNADTILVGQDVTFFLDVYNVGLQRAQNVPLAIELVNQSGGKNRLADMVIDSIAVDRYAPIEYSWQAGAVPGKKQIAMTVDPDNTIDELSEANNSIITSAFVHSDTIKPEIKITFDDREIFDGDLVASEPLIVATLADNNPELQLDSTSIKIYLDGGLVSLRDQNIVSVHMSETREELGQVHIQPVLDDGEHILQLEFSDMSHNKTAKRIHFVVESDLALRDVLNYPNPFAHDTEFCFHLTRQAQVRIKVFTVAGRLIRTIDPGFIDVGYHRIRWDGLDGDGDPLANGVYLYKILAESDDQKTDVGSKVIVMR